MVQVISRILYLECIRVLQIYTTVCPLLQFQRISSHVVSLQGLALHLLQQQKCQGDALNCIVIQIFVPVFIFLYDCA